MNKIHESSNGHSFSWNEEKREPEYNGQDGSKSADKNTEVFLSLSASYFLSGNTLPTLNVYSKGGMFYFSMTTFDGDITHVVIPAMPRLLDHNTPVCLSGEICRSPKDVSNFCRQFPCNKVYVCSVIDELPALGKLLSKVEARPRRIFFSDPVIDNSHEDDKKYFDFADNLPEECYGKLAECVGKDVPAVNTIRSVVGISPFYSRIISTRVIDDDPIFLVSLNNIDEFFPNEAISVKNYAATSVPVEVMCGDKFKEYANIDKDYVTLFALSSYIEGQTTFSNFYHLLSGKVVAMSYDMKSAVTDSLPVFTSNRVCRPK